MKTCCECKQSLPLDAFNKNKARKDGLQGICRECWKVYYKEKYYKGGKEQSRLAEKSKAERAKIKEYLDQAKSVPCADCGASYPPYVMDFDHLGGKEFNIGGAVSTKSLRLIKLEVAKCDVVCSNCHRERTWQRSHSPVV